MGQLVRLARDAQNCKTVYSVPQIEIDQTIQAVEIECTAFIKRCLGYDKNPLVSLSMLMHRSG